LSGQAIVERATREHVYNRATRIVASTLAGITTAAGVMHGWFELLQGIDAPAGGPIINAIGPEQRLWEYAALHAFTLIPSYLVTGLVAIALGIIATIWALAYIDTRPGPRVMLALSIALFLGGGGFGPLFTGVFASLVATRIRRPLTWWRAHLSDRVRDVLARARLWMLVLYVMVFLLAVETTIFGRPLTLLLDADTTYEIVLRAGNLTLLLMVLAVLSAFAHDIPRGSVPVNVAD
jgi:hypothetical protein